MLCFLRAEWQWKVHHLGHSAKCRQTRTAGDFAWFGGIFLPTRFKEKWGHIERHNSSPIDGDSKS